MNFHSAWVNFQDVGSEFPERGGGMKRWNWDGVELSRVDPWRVIIQLTIDSHAQIKTL